MAMTGGPLCVHCRIPSTHAVVDMARHGGPPISVQRWICSCGAYTGCIAGSRNPSGRPADRRTREARIATHRAIDPIWQTADSARCYDPQRTTRERFRRIARSKVYAYMAASLGLESADAHIGLYDLTTCRLASERFASVTYDDVHQWAARRPVPGR